MIWKVFILVLFTTCWFEAFAQSFNLKNTKEFHCYEWLPEFRDSILVFTKIEIIDQEKRYCTFVKEKANKYDFFCWTGNKGLESPTKWRDELKIKFKKESMIFKFGREKVQYKTIMQDEGVYLLVKQN